MPLMVLSGCSTGLSESVTGGRLAKTDLGGFARALTVAGVPAVLAMMAPVTDMYATALAARFYRELVIRSQVEVLAAFCDARRLLEQDRQMLAADRREARLVEWSTPTLFMRESSLMLYDENDGFKRPPERPFTDVSLRHVGQFVGRRAEIRTLLSALHDDTPGVLLHGIGGVGKSSLAAELLRQLGHEAGLIVPNVGQTSVDQLLYSIGLALLTVADDQVRQLAEVIRRPDCTWVERLRVLTQVFARVPITLLLDDFEGNLKRRDAKWTVTDDELAEFLSTWISNPGTQRLLITSRYPLSLPSRAHRRLVTHNLGPLSLAETRKLMWRLPTLSSPEQQRIYTDIGGHPRALKYLDVLLREGQGRYTDVTERLETILLRRGIKDGDSWLRGPFSFDRALAEGITLAIEDALVLELIDLLDSETRGILSSASVYRIPVNRVGLAWPVSAKREYIEVPTRHGQQVLEPDEFLKKAPPDNRSGAKTDLSAPITEPEGIGEAIMDLANLGLLAVSKSDDDVAFYMVHRWIAVTLGRSTFMPSAHLRVAHSAAASHWWWRVQEIPQSRQQDIPELLEARYHYHAAGHVEAALLSTELACNQLHVWGLRNWIQVFIGKRSRGSRRVMLIAL